MYEVHKYMGLNNAEGEFPLMKTVDQGVCTNKMSVGYFITQVGLAATSFGVTADDATAVGKALTDAFGYRCSAPAAIPASAEPALQAICIADDCPIATANATCSSYEAVAEPATATMSATMSATGTGSMASGTQSATGTASPTASMPAQSTGGAGSVVAGLGLVGAGVAAVLAL